jgi:hypothetical protein
MLDSGASARGMREIPRKLGMTLVGAGYSPKTYFVS